MSFLLVDGEDESPGAGHVCSSVSSSDSRSRESSVMLRDTLYLLQKSPKSMNTGVVYTAPF